MKPRVLIADDEPRMARSIQLALEKNGLACELAGSGEEALAVFRKNGADLVLTDWRIRGDKTDLHFRITEPRRRGS
jgi:two-component system OmpR family response regulator